MEVETYSEKGEAFVSWDSPKFVDNSNSALVVSQNIDPGSFRVGLYNITYRAADETGNTAYCIFELVVLQKGRFEIRWKYDCTLNASFDNVKIDEKYTKKLTIFYYLYEEMNLQKCSDT